MSIVRNPTARSRIRKLYAPSKRLPSLLSVIELPPKNSPSLEQRIGMKRLGPAPSVRPVHMAPEDCHKRVCACHRFYTGTTVPCRQSGIIRSYHPVNGASTRQVQSVLWFFPLPQGTPSMALPPEAGQSIKKYWTIDYLQGFAASSLP